MTLFARAPASPAAELVLEPVSRVLGRQIEAVESLATGLSVAGRDLGAGVTSMLLVLVVVPALAALVAAVVASVRTAAGLLRRQVAR